MTKAHAPTDAASPTTWETAPTHTIAAGGVEFAYVLVAPGPFARVRPIDLVGFGRVGRSTSRSEAWAWCEPLESGDVLGDGSSIVRTPTSRIVRSICSVRIAIARSGRPPAISP